MRPERNSTVTSQSKKTNTPEFTSALDCADVPQEEVVSIDELITKLRNDLDEVTVIRTDETPPVIRLTETSLTSIKNYPLNQKVSLTFSGTLYDLLEKLEGQLGNVSNFRGGIGPPMADWFTETKISVTGLSVISLLDKAVPRSSGRRILWTAETTLHNKTSHTEIQFGLDYDAFRDPGEE